MGRNKYPEETVAKILDAALELFCAQGYEGTSIQDIVDRLDGMTKGAVYHHFKSKEEIFNAAFDRAMTPIVEHRRSMLGVGNLTGAQKLKRLYAPESVVPQIELWARIRPAADPVKSSRLLAMQYQGSFDESADGYLLPVIEEGVADGSIACECPREAAEAVSLLANLWAAAIVPSARAQGANGRSRAMFDADGGRSGSRFGGRSASNNVPNLGRLEPCRVVIYILTVCILM